MLDFKDGILQGGYRQSALEPSGLLREIGESSYNVDVLEKGCQFRIVRKSFLPQNIMEERLTVVYKDFWAIESIKAEGKINEADYEFRACMNGRKMDFRATVGKDVKKHTMKPPDIFLELNTFPYILPWLFKDEPELCLPLLIPASTALLKTRITKYSHVEKVDIGAREYDCYRVGLEIEEGMQAKQFLLYHSTSHQLIKGTMDNSYFEWTG